MRMNTIHRRAMRHHLAALAPPTSLKNEDDVVRLYEHEIQKGDGMMGRIMMGISSLSGKVGMNSSNWRPAPDPTGSEYAGTHEVHLPGYNFCGPSTYFKLRMARGDQPVDDIDEASMHHDAAYQRIADGVRDGTIRSRAEVHKLVRHADLTMLAEMGNNKKFNTNPMIRRFIVSKVIGSKAKFEQLGWMDSKKFVTSDPFKQEPVDEEPENTDIDNDAVQAGEGMAINQDVMIHQNAGLKQQGKEKEYDCCQSCHEGLPVCEKMPAYRLKLRLLGIKR